MALRLQRGTCAAAKVFADEWLGGTRLWVWGRGRTSFSDLLMVLSMCIEFPSATAVPLCPAGNHMLRGIACRICVRDRLLGILTHPAHLHDSRPASNSSDAQSVTCNLACRCKAGKSWRLARLLDLEYLPMHANMRQNMILQRCRRRFVWSLPRREHAAWPLPLPWPGEISRSWRTPPAMRTTLPLPQRQHSIRNTSKLLALHSCARDRSAHTAMSSLNLKVKQAPLL